MKCAYPFNALLHVGYFGNLFGKTRQDYPEFDSVRFFFSVLSVLSRPEARSQWNSTKVGFTKPEKEIRFCALVHVLQGLWAGAIQFSIGWRFYLPSMLSTPKTPRRCPSGISSN
jgi:hypothetical protein